MSGGNWVDADFSGLSNLHEKIRLFQYAALQIYRLGSLRAAVEKQ